MRICSPCPQHRFRLPAVDSGALPPAPSEPSVRSMSTRRYFARTERTPREPTPVARPRRESNPTSFMFVGVLIVQSEAMDWRIAFIVFVAADRGVGRRVPRDVSGRGGARVAVSCLSDRSTRVPSFAYAPPPCRPVSTLSPWVRGSSRALTSRHCSWRAKGQTSVPRVA